MKKIWKITSLMAMSALAFGLGAVAWNGVSASAETGEVVAQNEAALTVDGVTTEYATYAEALSVAENDGIENAKITLLSDATGTLDWIYHSLTVDLAGYTLDQAVFPLARDNSPTLIIEDSSAEQTGRINTKGGITFSTVERGTIIINGGTISSLSIATNSNGNATVTVNDGYMESCSLNFLSDGSTGYVELKGGKIQELYAQAGEGTILLKGGQYKWIYGNDMLDPDFLVSEIIPEGYKMFGADGRAVDVSGNRLWLQDWATVEEHTVCDYTSYLYTTDVHWQGCVCGETEVGVVTEEHRFVDFEDSEVHGQECEVCAYQINVEEHSWDRGVCSSCEYEHYCQMFNEEKICEICGKQGTEANFAISVNDGETEVYYTNLQAAIGDAPENAVVTLLQDVYTWGEDLYIDKPLLLDLNGRSIGCVSLEDIVVQANVVIIDGKGGGLMELTLRLESLCTLEGGTYMDIYVNMEGVSPSDFLPYGRHFYVENGETGVDELITDEEVASSSFIKVIYDCTHEETTKSYDDTIHWDKCLCGMVLGEEGHELVWTVTKEATETEAGEKTGACECGYVETEEIPMLTPEDPDTGSDESSDVVNPGEGSDVVNPGVIPNVPNTPSTPNTNNGTNNDSTSTNNKKDKDEGCGGVIGGSLALVVTAIGAVAICKKKEN